MNELKHDFRFIIDQLTNSMEFYTKEDFVNHIGGQTDFTPSQLSNIFDAYWELSPIDRINFNNSDWQQFVLNGFFKKTTKN